MQATCAAKSVDQHKALINRHNLNIVEVNESVLSHDFGPNLKISPEGNPHHGLGNSTD